FSDRPSQHGTRQSSLPCARRTTKHMADELLGGPTRPPWRPSRWLLLTAGFVLTAGVVAAVVVIASSGGSSSARRLVSAPQTMTTPPFTCPSPPATPPLAPQSRTVGLLLRSPRGPVAAYPYVARDSA